MRRIYGLAALGVVAIAVGVYVSTSLKATPPERTDFAEIEALREDLMRKLMFAQVPSPVSSVPFLDEDGAELTLAAFEGQHVVLNFWATWCAPCRKEMPSLANLQAERGGDKFRVVTIATGRNEAVAIDRFFTDVGIEGLPKYLDPQGNLARDMGVLGLPITMIIDPQGNEIARLRGDAEWDTPSAFAIIDALVES